MDDMADRCDGKELASPQQTSCDVRCGRPTSTAAESDPPMQKYSKAILMNADTEPPSKTTTSIHRQHLPSQPISLEPTTPPKAAKRISARQDIGKDWESWRLTEADRLDPTPPWQRRPKHSVPTRGNEELPERPTRALNFSEIQPLLVLSPKPPTETRVLLSPISLAPQSPELTEGSAASSPQPPTPEVSDIPKYVTAFDYAMRPFMDVHSDCEQRLYLPSPNLSGETSQSTSPLLPPLRDDEVSYAGSQDDTVETDNPEYGFPPHLKVKHSFRLRMLHIHLRTLLMRCTILQATIRDLERKPWAQDAQQPPYWYYSKMRHLAQKARRIAEALESRDLRARCEYWTGRACGGTRDYHAAAEHFALAIKLDVENDMHPSGKIRLRGLRPNEKEDVHFLLDSVTNRHEEWEQKTVNARNVAKYESIRSNKPLEECVDWSNLQSPLWVPDRDRVVQLVQQEFGIKKRLGNRAKFLEHLERARLGQELGRKVKTQWDAEGIDAVEMTRRILDEKEWHYIQHGDAKAPELCAGNPSDAKVELLRPAVMRRNGRSDLGSSSSSSSSSARDRSSKKASHLSHPTLEDELGQADLNSASPSPLHTLSRTPSPVGGIAQRRNIAVEPIYTEHIQSHMSLGAAVRAASEVGGAFSPAPLLEGRSGNSVD